MTSPPNLRKRAVISEMCFYLTSMQDIQFGLYPVYRNNIPMRCSRHIISRRDDIQAPSSRYWTYFHPGKEHGAVG